MQPNQIFSHWKQIRADLISIIDQFDNNELAYKPFETSWSAGQIMLHIAEAEDGWLRYVVTCEIKAWPKQFRMEDYPKKEDILKVLSEVHGRTEQYLATLDEAQLMEMIKTPWGEVFSLYWIIWHVIEHEIHHRGEISLIRGLLGYEGLDV